MNNPEDSKQTGTTNQTDQAIEGCAQASCSARFGVAYREQKTAWKIAPYPLRATPDSARKLIEWLQSQPRFMAMEMRVVSVALLPNVKAEPRRNQNL